MKNYNLNIKKVILVVLLLIIIVGIVVCLVLFTTNDDKMNLLIEELRFSAREGSNAVGSVYFCGILAFFALLYNLALLLYRRKNVLELSEKGIVYYAPEYGRMEFLKEDIKDIYFVRSQMKIILNNKLKRRLFARVLSFFKDAFLGGISEDIFRINLAFIKCDVSEVQNAVMELKLDSGSEEATSIVRELCEKYKLDNIYELSKNEIALNECIMNLYNMDKFSQKEIATITKVSANKVSKIIRKNI